ncbi:family 16 glycoside hydrolase [Marinimicrobium sp. LS-A18]|uniref:family 16 glycoside hydrolase n=1 Tax=Marinimicrobium sp. LS-A18 TaxID=1381596 RepID=UPI000467EAD4|nr:family 16 glycoside hydrolase [Marinimicrobium sp. LS-A18]
MKYRLIGLVLGVIASSGVFAAGTIEWEGREFEARNVKASVVELKGEQVLRVERDLEALPFDVERLGETVDEPHYMRLKDVAFTDVTFEVKMLARVLQPSPFAGSQGFIGVYFRAAEDDSAFDSIYLRPNAGRSDNQRVRNHTVQYFAYPDYKFDKLRDMAPGLYETWADVGMDEWITMRVHVKGDTARAFINDAKYPSFIVDDLLGSSKSGGVGLYVDIGTEGYFKDFKIISSSSPEAGGV